MQKLIDSIKERYVGSSALDVVQKRVARIGYTGVEVYGMDSEKDSEESDGVDQTVEDLRRAIPKVDEQTVSKWQKAHNIKVSICWLSVFIIISNFFWPWIPNPLSVDWTPVREDK